MTIFDGWRGKWARRALFASIIPAGVFSVVGVTALSASALSLSETRSLDGTGNNLNVHNRGKIGTDFDRKGPANYSDGLSALANGPNPRDISNKVFDQPVSIFSGKGLSDFTWAWGQFLSHDITHALSGREFETILIPANDPLFTPGQVIPTTRSRFNPTTGITSPRQQINDLTPWIDAGSVYGGLHSEVDGGKSRADWLRAGSGGKLEISLLNGKAYLPVAGQKSGAPGMAEGSFGIADHKRFVAGDVRANENGVLMSLHTLLLREHNRLTDDLASRYSSELVGMDAKAQDEFLYQAAKKVVGAQLQAVTYNEYLPALGIRLGKYKGYNANVDPTVTNEFATAAFRIGHTQISGSIKRLNVNGTEHAAGDLSLFKAFFNPDAFHETDMDSLFRGLASQAQQEIDTKITNDLRNLLFGPPTAGPFLNGTDLASLNIQRGRDHGLGSYNDTRQAFGLAAASSFADITSDFEVQQALKSAYGDVGSIDLWVGLLAEDHMPGASVGELVNAMWSDQFGRLRDGDRFWYANDADFQADGVLAKAGFDHAYWRNFTLGQLISNNTGIAPGSLGRHGNVFFAAPIGNDAQAVPEPISVFSSLVVLGAIAARRRQQQPG